MTFFNSVCKPMHSIHLRSTFLPILAKTAGRHELDPNWQLQSKFLTQPFVCRLMLQWRSPFASSEATFVSHRLVHESLFCWTNAKISNSTRLCAMRSFRSILLSHQCAQTNFSLLDILIKTCGKWGRQCIFPMDNRREQSNPTWPTVTKGSYVKRFLNWHTSYDRLTKAS